MATALGLRAFTGWAVAVAVKVEEGGLLRVVERERVGLLPPTLPAQVYHVAQRLGPREARQLIEDVAAEACSAAEAAIRDLAGRAGDGLAAAGLIVKRGPPPHPPTHARMSHTGWHAAEGELYRYALLRGIEAAALNATLVPEVEARDLAAAALDLRMHELNVRLSAMGAGLGPPWTDREKMAALAGWLALVGAAGSQGRALDTRGGR
ncbi:MAG TPA: hypothetical protein VNN10_01735 [Dehalococcoidia bacterium]|nr:hypothetical protein [Dehalococcoidia bacterium]